MDFSNFLPTPPWGSLPIPLAFREVLGLTGEEKITITKQTFLTFVHSVRDMGYGPTVADAKRLLEQSEPHLTQRELDNLDLIYTLWIAAENPEEVKRYGLQ